MKVEIYKTPDVKSIYLEHLKVYPGETETFPLRRSNFTFYFIFGNRRVLPAQDRGGEGDLRPWPEGHLQMHGHKGPEQGNGE